MSEEKILEAIAIGLEKCDGLAVAFRPPKARYRFEAGYVLKEIKSLLPPSDLVKVWEGESLVISSNGDKPYDTEIILSSQKKKHIEVYIREVKS